MNEVQRAQSGRWSVVIDHQTGSSDVIRMLVAQRQASGEFRFSHSLSISNAAPTSALDLLPRDFALLHTASSEKSSVALGEGPDGLVYANVWDRLVNVVALSTSVRIAKELAELAMAKAPRIATRSSVEIRSWALAPNGPESIRRPMPVHNWMTSAVNYPHQTRVALSRAMSLSREPERGRIMLWHGPPGTGKTNALRALANSWSGWCDVHVISDAPQFFGSSVYMSHVLDAGYKGRDGALERAKLLVMEDADEFLRMREFAPTAGAFGRLLNLTDGVLGDGSRALVLLTTNCDAATLDPALTRPGRCFASVRFDEFSPEEAREWLPDGARGPRGPVTLSDLYAKGGEYL